MINTYISPNLAIICGHSGCAVKGSDIVCAAASMLLETAASMGKDIPELDCVKFEGCAVLDMNRVKDAEARSGILNMLYNGFGLLAANYPDRVKLSLGKGFEETAKQPSPAKSVSPRRRLYEL